MRAYTGKILVAVVIVAIIGLIALARSRDLEQRAESDARYSQRRADQDRSFKEGPRYETTKQLADGEEISVLLVPDWRSAYADERCIIYKNKNIGAVAMHCPGEVGRDLEVFDIGGDNCVSPSDC